MADVAEAPIAEPAALFKKRKPKTNVRKRPATPPPASDDDSSDYSSQDENGVKVKRRRKNGVAVTASTTTRTDVDSLGATKYQADQSTTINVSNDATKSSNWYDENGEGAMSAQQLLGKSSHTKKDEPTNDGTYKGSSNYTNYIQKNPNAPNKQMGPMKASANVRTITTMDFKPDICKDYAKTGYCGFGDACIFLHDRADWKQGWQLDRDWEIETKGKKQQGKTVASANRMITKEDEENEEEAKMLENIPFACKICELPYKKPAVQTKCGHYFCEKCALDRYKKNPSCAICGSGTNGVFNNAKNLNKLLDRKRERERKMKEAEAAGEGGEER